MSKYEDHYDAGYEAYIVSVHRDIADLQDENAKLQADIAELRGTIECLKGLAEANAEKCYTCEAMLDCDECLRADASHKELRGLQAEIKALHELVRDMHDFYCVDDDELGFAGREEVVFSARVLARMTELGIGGAE